MRIDPGVASLLRARFMAAAPFGFLLGLTFGAVLVRNGVINVGLVPVLGLALPAASYVSLLLQGAVLTAGRIEPDSVPSDLIGLGFDAGLGAAIGHFAAPVFGVSAIQSASAASGLLCLQTLLIEKVLIGNVFGEALNGLLFPGGSRERPSWSRAEALAALGNYQAAQREFERQIARFPADAATRIRYARMLRTGPNKYQIAVDVLQQVLQMRKLDFESETAAARELSDLLAGRLRQPNRGALVLLRYLERHEGRAEAVWARRRLDELAQALHKSGPVRSKER